MKTVAHNSKYNVIPNLNASLIIVIKLLIIKNRTIAIKKI